ncbi:MAG: hypothetical protein M8349_03890 [ANME-2 cluster archaeon]|nr:hypothetical protein [ANME-2 cluster archaeon]
MDYKKDIAILFTFMCLISPAMASQNLDSKDIKDGSTWDIGSGYYIRVEGVDYQGKQAFVSIWDRGEMLKENLMQAGDQFEYRDSSNTQIVSMKLTSVFRGMTGSSCHFNGIYLRYGESSSTATSTATSTAIKTAVPTDTPSPRGTMVVAFGEGALIPGLTAPIIGAILILTALMMKRRKSE